MKRQIVSFLCVVSLLFSMLLPVTAGAEKASALSIQSVFNQGENAVFTVNIGTDTLSYDNARLVVSIYDADGNTVRTANETVSYDEVSKTITIPYSPKAVSYKAMLLDSGNKLKPLTPALSGEIVFDKLGFSGEVNTIKNTLVDLDVLNKNLADSLSAGAYITRGEFAYALATMLCIDYTDAIYKNANIYSDVTSGTRYAGAINLVAQSNLVPPLSSDTFGADEYITYRDAVAAAVRALGYEVLAQAQGEYGYIQVAHDYGITNGIEPAEYLSSDNFVKLMQNASEAPLMMVTSLSESEPVRQIMDGKGPNAFANILTGKGICKVTGVVGANDGNEIEFMPVEDCNCGELWADRCYWFDIGKTNIFKYQNCVVDVYVQKSGREYMVLSVSPSPMGKTLTICSDDIESIDSNRLSYFVDILNSSKTKDIKLADNIPVEFNKGAKWFSLSELASIGNTKLTFIENTGDSVYDCVVATQYSYDIVELVKEDYISLINNSRISFDFEDEDVTFVFEDSNGTPLDLADFGPGDVVAITADDTRPSRYYNYIQITKITDKSFVGTTEEIAQSEYYNTLVIDGKKYKDVSFDSLDLGGTYRFYLGMNGEIVYCDENTEPVPSYGDGAATPSPEEDEEKLEITYETAAELVAKLGFTDGFVHNNGDREITRGEFAKTICNIVFPASLTGNFKTANVFDDITSAHPYAGEINYLAKNNMMQGVTDSKFAAEEIITYADAMMVVMKVLGYTPMMNVDSNPVNHIRLFDSLGLSKGITICETVNSRTMVRLMYNMMFSPLLISPTPGTYEIMDGSGPKEYITPLVKNNIFVATGVVGEKDGTYNDFMAYEDSKCGTFQENRIYSFKIGNSNISDYRYRCANTYVLKNNNSYTVLAVVPSAVGMTVRIVSDDISYVESCRYLEYYTDFPNSNKTKEIKLGYDMYVEYNMGAVYYTLEELASIPDVEMLFIENTGDSAFDAVIATQYTYDVVEAAEAEDSSILLASGQDVQLDFEDEDITTILTDKEGNSLDISDFKPGDVVAVVADANRPSRYDSYIKFVNLSDSKVEGVVEEIFTLNDYDYITVNGKEYILDVEDDIYPGDAGVFYIGLTGKIVYFDEDRSDDESTLSAEGYGYVLEGALSNGVFTDTRYQLKILTANDGIVTFDISEKNYDDIYENYINKEGNFAFDNDTFLWENATAENKVATHRLVEYKLNAVGEIREIAHAAGTFKNFAIADNHEYDADIQSINGASLEDDVVIFNVDVTDADDASAVDIRFLVDNAKYTGYALKDADDKYSLMVISDSESEFSAEDGFAVATKVSIGINADGDEIKKVTYVQNEEEGELTFEDGVSVEVTGSKHDFAVGDIFMFVADAEGLVSEYIIIAEVNDGLIQFVGNQAEIEAILKTDKTETSFVLGYIENDRRVSVSIGEIITVGGKEFVVRNSAYKYTFNEIGRNRGIIVSEFMYDADYCELNFDQETDEPDGTATACPVLIRLVDDKVVDIYGTNKPATIPAPQHLLEYWN